jgi:phosphatidylglycerophosphatase A
LAWAIGHWPLAWQSAAIAGLFLVGVPICRRAAGLLRSKDPSAVVFDEIAAMPVVFLLIPFGLATSIAGFLLFRLFDIAKPWPIRRFERLPGGWGIMADDFVAGLYAGGLLWCAVRLLLYAGLVNV